MQRDPKAKQPRPTFAIFRNDSGIASLMYKIQVTISRIFTIVFKNLPALSATQLFIVAPGSFNSRQTGFVHSKVQYPLYARHFRSNFVFVYLLSYVPTLTRDLSEFQTAFFSCP